MEGTSGAGGTGTGTGASASAGASAGSAQAASTQTAQGESTQSAESTQTESVNTETQVETPAEKKRHKLYESLKKYFPDKDYADDNSVMDDADSKLSELSDYFTDNEAANKKFVDFLDANDDWRGVLMMGLKGMSLREAIARTFDPSELTAEEGDPDFDALEKAKNERLKNKEDNDKFLAELNDNIKVSQEDARSFIDEMGMDEESAAKFTQSVSDVFTDAYKGKITKDTLAKLYVAENHEKEVAAAAENGFIEGKNAKIDEKKAAPVTDGLPQIEGIQTPPPQAQPKSTDIGNIVEHSRSSRKF